jgi:hypothetical protein
MFRQRTVVCEEVHITLGRHILLVCPHHAHVTGPGESARRIAEESAASCCAPAKWRGQVGEELRWLQDAGARGTACLLRRQRVEVSYPYWHDVMLFKSAVIQVFTPDIRNNTSAEDAAGILFQRHANGSGSGWLPDYLDALPGVRVDFKKLLTNSPEYRRARQPSAESESYERS